MINGEEKEKQRGVLTHSHTSSLEKKSFEMKKNRSYTHTYSSLVVSEGEV